jgi:hypothetical protein
MDEHNEDVIVESSPEEVIEEVEETTPEPEPQVNQDKTIPYDRFQEVIKENKKLKEQSKTSSGLDVSDYIDISASLEGLDQKEKEYLAKQHKLSGESLKDIRNSEDFALWQTAYRAKVEKEQLAMRPSSTQSESEGPKSFTEKLKTASLREKEELLRSAGLYKDPKPRPDRVDLGRGGK